MKKPPYHYSNLLHGAAKQKPAPSSSCKLQQEKNLLRQAAVTLSKEKTYSASLLQPARNQRSTPTVSRTRVSDQRRTFIVFNNYSHK